MAQEPFEAWPEELEGVPLRGPAMEIVEMAIEDPEAFGEHVTMWHDDPIAVSVLGCAPPRPRCLVWVGFHARSPRPSPD